MCDPTSLPQDRSALPLVRSFPHHEHPLRRLPPLSLEIGCCHQRAGSRRSSLIPLPTSISCCFIHEHPRLRCTSGARTPGDGGRRVTRSVAAESAVAYVTVTMKPVPHAADVKTEAADPTSAKQVAHRPPW